MILKPSHLYDVITIRNEVKTKRTSSSIYTAILDTKAGQPPLQVAKRLKNFQNNRSEGRPQTGLKLQALSSHTFMMVSASPATVLT